MKDYDFLYIQKKYFWFPKKLFNMCSLKIFPIEISLIPSLGRRETLKIYNMANLDLKKLMLVKLIEHKNTKRMLIYGGI